MILRNSINVMIKGIQTGRSHYANLTHRTAQALFPAPGAFNTLGFAGENSAEWRAQRLGKIQVNRIEKPSKINCLQTAGNAGVHQAGAI